MIQYQLCNNYKIYQTVILVHNFLAIYNFFTFWMQNISFMCGLTKITIYITHYFLKNTMEIFNLFFICDSKCLSILYFSNFENMTNFKNVSFFITHSQIGIYEKDVGICYIYHSMNTRVR